MLNTFREKNVVYEDMTKAATLALGSLTKFRGNMVEQAGDEGGKFYYDAIRSELICKDLTVSKRSWIRKMFSGMKDTFGSMKDAFMAVWSKISDFFGALMGPVAKFMKTAWNTVFSWMKHLAEDVVWETLKKKIPNGRLILIGLVIVLVLGALGVLSWKLVAAALGVKNDETRNMKEEAIDPLAAVIACCQFVVGKFRDGLS